MGSTTTGFQVNGADIGLNLVDKSYLMNQYPELYNQYRFAGLWTWGANSNGELGDNTTVPKSLPITTIAGAETWKQIRAGYLHNAAIKSDGTFWLWGRNTYGQLGDNTVTPRSSPVQTISFGTNWKLVATGGYHTPAIKTDGTLWSMGRNAFGQLGDNTTVVKSSPIQTVAIGTNWRQAAGGGNHTAAIKNDGTMWIWGYNNFGQIGDNTTVNKSSPVQTISFSSIWKQVSCGNNHTAATKTDGTLWVWGYNFFGQVGDNTTVYRSSPVQTISTGTNWSQISAGANHTTAIKTDGTLWSWGYNANGYLGDGTTNNRSSPVQTVSGGTNWKVVSGGYTGTAAIKTDGTLWTWGDNFLGQLGDGTIINKSSPVQIIAPSVNWQSVSFGNTHVISIRNDSSDTLQSNLQTFYQINSIPLENYYIPLAPFSYGGLWLSGRNNYGQVGDNSLTWRSSPVQTVAYGINWLQVGNGTFHSAVIKSNGTLWLWGRNSNGQLGDNTAADKSSPIQTVAGGTNWKQVSGGFRHSAAIKADGTLWTWGWNIYGQLGDNSATSKSSPVQTIGTAANWKQVSSGSTQTSAVKTDGTLWSWGLNGNGQLGDNSVTSRSSPVQTVSGGTNWSVVSSGDSHTAAIKTDGSLWTWGRNSEGQLGDGTTVQKSSPVQTVATGTTWKQISCGLYHCAALQTDGTLWLWGNNGNGQLGDNSTTNRTSPVQTVSGGTNWRQVSGGYSSTGAVKTDGSLWLWGYNFYGQLGDGTTIQKSSPVQTVARGNNWNQVSCGVGYTFSALQNNSPY